MPRGYEIAQRWGLLPRGYSSSGDEEGPRELPDGRLVCGPHGFVVCPRCGSDYSLMTDGTGDDEIVNENRHRDLLDVAPDIQAQPRQATASALEAQPRQVSADDRAVRRGTGRVFPTVFTPPRPGMTPEQVFTGERCRDWGFLRRTLPRDQRTCLILTDGACPHNGNDLKAKAGWAFWHGLIYYRDKPLVVSGLLEEKGPFGDPGRQTSNRAELRAVMAALRFLHWPDEGFRTLVIATDSEHVVKGATDWSRNWLRNGWLTQKGEAVLDKDLWQALMGEFERLKDAGLDIKFWKIDRPGELNRFTDAAANRMARSPGKAPDAWHDVPDLLSV